MQDKNLVMYVRVPMRTTGHTPEQIKRILDGPSTEQFSKINIKGRYALLKPATMKPGYRTPEQRLVKLTGGFGCEVDATFGQPYLGTKCYATHVLDGSEYFYRRHEIERVYEGGTDL